MQVNPYLTFNGNCEQAFKFYAQCLGGKITAMMPHAGTPAEGHVPANWLNKIIHARLELAGMTLMGSDAPPDRYKAPGGFSVTIGVDQPAEAERIFKALGDKGTIHMAMEKTFFAERFGMLTDSFGTPWMVICENAAAKAA
jgi:PhnB protein